MPDRRGFLKCMAWAGTGLLCSLSGGVVTSHMLGDAVEAAPADFTFVQISDSHIGFNKPANANVTATFQEAIDKVNALPTPPAFVVHTGDLTHTAQADQFDTVQQMLKTIKVPVFVIPGEHDVIGDNGQLYRSRLAQNTVGEGWYSFDVRGVHCVALINVLDLKPGGMGSISRDQLEWLEQDLKPLRSSTPVVVLAHMPLWTIDAEWGWGTDESEEVLGYLKRFGSVTVLNGHIHQAIRKIEGNVSFHTAMSTAYPQPAPGTAAQPGPLKVDADKLKSVLGVTNIHSVRRQRPLAVIDVPLAEVAQ